MGGQQSIGKNDAVLKPLYYNSAKVSLCAKHMIDVLTDGKSTLSPEEIFQIEKAFPSSQIITEKELNYEADGRWYFKPKKSAGDIVEIISCDPDCRLRYNDRHLHIGVGRFNYPNWIAWATDISIEHRTDLKAEDGTPLYLEVKFYILEQDLKDAFSPQLNFKVAGKLYGMSLGAMGELKEPLRIVISGDYKRLYRRTPFNSARITTMHVETILADPRIRDFARNQNSVAGVDFICQSMPPSIVASVHTDRRQEFEAFLNEILGGQTEMQQIAAGNGYRIEWSDENDLDEIEQSEEEKERQIKQDVQIQLIKVESDIRRLIEVGLFSYDEPQ